MAEQLVTIAQLARDPKYPFTEASLRWFVFRAHENGLAASGAVRRIGRRVYIDTASFDRWIDSQREVAA